VGFLFDTHSWVKVKPGFSGGLKPGFCARGFRGLCEAWPLIAKWSEVGSWNDWSVQVMAETQNHKVRDTYRSLSLSLSFKREALDGRRHGG
jgi:hypothetical protein